MKNLTLILACILMVFSTNALNNDEMNKVQVDLYSFDLQAYGNDAHILWSTTQEINNAAFKIERSANGGGYNVIAIVQGAGTSSEMNTYNYIDKDLPSGNYSYRLIDYGNNIIIMDDLEI